MDLRIGRLLPIHRVVRVHDASAGSDVREAALSYCNRSFRAYREAAAKPCRLNRGVTTTYEARDEIALVIYGLWGASPIVAIMAVAMITPTPETYSRR